MFVLKLFHLYQKIWTFLFLKYLFLVHCIGSWLWHFESSSLTRDRTQAPCIGSAVLATGPPGNSLNFFLDVNVCFGIFCLTWSHYCSQVRSSGILSSAYFFGQLLYNIILQVNLNCWYFCFSSVVHSLVVYLDTLLFTCQLSLCLLFFS